VTVRKSNGLAGFGSSDRQTVSTPMPPNGSSIPLSGSSSNRPEALLGAVNAMASGSHRRVTVWNGPRATTLREKPDAERVQHRPGARQVAERGHAEVQRPELLGHILPGGILCGEPSRSIARKFSQVKPFWVHQRTMNKHPQNGADRRTSWRTACHACR